MTPTAPTPTNRPTLDVRLVTFRGVHEGILPTYPEFRPVEREYLTGNLDPRRDALATVCVWDVHASRWLLPPEYLAGYRSQAEGNRQRVLAVAYHYMPGLNDPDWAIEPDPDEQPARLSADFAWRLERHWLVEWSDLPKGRRRPPVIFVSPYQSNALIGADLPPRLLGIQAALFAFPLVTADELRVALRVLRQPDPDASDLSRALAYLEEAGMLHEAPAALAEAYWKRRSLTRRPLRLYVSVPHQAEHWEGRFRTLGVQQVRIDDWTYVADIDRALDGQVSHGIKASIRTWEAYADVLHNRGLRTVWHPARVSDVSACRESDPRVRQVAEDAPPSS